MGLEGETPEKIVPDSIEQRVETIGVTKEINFGGRLPLRFDRKTDLVLHFDKALPEHPNGMRFYIYDADATLLASREYYSVGGGFVVTDETQKTDNLFYKKDKVSNLRSDASVIATLPFTNASDLLATCAREKASIARVVWENEKRWRSEAEIRERVLAIWRAMDASIHNGCYSTKTYLPGKLNVRRRAPGLFQRLSRQSLVDGSQGQSLAAKAEFLNRPIKPTLTFLDWLSCYAIAVNEENAAGGRVVTAPTNGAAGSASRFRRIRALSNPSSNVAIPAVLKYHMTFIANGREEDADAGELGRHERGASISAAEMGCQGEVGVASSMAAAGLTAVMGGTVAQVENAAEIAMEHSLGLTCDPVAGLVQIPCIERNAIGAATAVTASQLALNGDGTHRVSLDQCISAMRQTGIDMMTKYQETSLVVWQHVPLGCAWGLMTV